MKRAILLAVVCAACGGALAGDEWNHQDHLVPAVYIPDGCWFDTLCTPGAKPKATMRFKRTTAKNRSSSTTDVFGTKTVQDGCFILNADGSYFYYRYGTSASNSKTTYHVAGTDFAAVCETNLYLNGSKVQTAKVGDTSACTETICFPGQRYANSMIVKSFKLESNGSVACDLVACETNGVAGFWDKQNARFVALTGTGTPLAVPYDDDGALTVYPTYTVTVDGTATNELASATVMVKTSADATPVAKTIAEILPLDGVLRTGTFIKRGTGFLEGCTNLVNFLGEFRIEQGAYVVTAPGQLGPMNQKCGIVRVSDGASLGLDVRIALGDQRLYVNNHVYAAGTGCQGKGALYNDTNDAVAGGNNMCACFWGRIILTGDATFGGKGGKWGDKAEAEAYELNGHTLTIASKGYYRTNGARFYDGHIVVNEKCGMNPQCTLTFGGGTSNSITFKAGSSWSGYHAGRFSFSSLWTLHLIDSWLEFSGNAESCTSYWNSVTYDNWNKPAVVEGVVKVSNTAVSKSRYAMPFSFNDFVSGPGGFNVRRGFLYFNSATNDFGGPISVTPSSKNYIACVGFLNANAYPAANDCTLTNQNGAIYVKEDDTLLPKVDYTVDSGYTEPVVYGPGTLRPRGLVKRGAGTLALELPVGVNGRTELLAGTIQVARPRQESIKLYSSKPGLYESFARYDSGLPSGFATAWYVNGADTPTNRVTSYPVYAEKTGTPDWTQYQAVRYQGYVWNRRSEPVTWSFASSFASYGELYIDGERAVGSWYKDGSGSWVQCDWHSLRTNTVTLASGPHKFDFRAYNSGYSEGGAKPAYKLLNDATGKEIADLTPNWPKNFGLTFKEGASTLVSSDYAIPTNGVISGFGGGDGILFTLDDRTEAECGAEIAAKERELVMGGYFMSSFTNLLACAGTAIDLQNGCHPLYVVDFAGSTCVRNGSIVIVKRWTISDSDALPTDGTAYLTAPEGTVTFDAGATIRVTGGAALHAKTHRRVKLVDAGYKGTPAIEVDAADPTAGNWALRTDAAGALNLEYLNGLAVILR